jgi:nucleotide-binding universal stress UspA family protein
MKMIVPLDGSALAEQAVDYAKALATGRGEILLLGVLPPARPELGLFGDVKVSARGVFSRMQAEMTDELHAVAERLRSALPETKLSVHIPVGDPAEQIIATASDQGADLIVMASHGRGAVGRIAIGSVADRVARTSDTPVMIIRPLDAAAAPKPISIDRLLVALDGSELAAQALPFAESLAKWLNVPVHVISAIDITQLTSFSLVAGGMFSDGLYEELIGELRQDLEHKFEDQLAPIRASGVTVELEIVDGPAVPVIENATRDGDVVIMTSHGRGGIGRWVIGSVAEKLVRHCPVPVILVHAKQLAENGESPGERASPA